MSQAPQHASSHRSPSQPQAHLNRPAPASTLALDVLPEDQEDTGAEAGVSVAASASDEPSLEELRSAYAELKRELEQQRAVAAASEPVAHPAHPAKQRTQKEPDPFEPDDLVTLLLPSIYRAVIEGKESKTHRAFIAGEQPGQVNEDTGRPGPGIAVTLTFTGGVCRDMPYSVAKGLKKSRAYRSNDALKVVPNDTPETEFAKLCGVQPMQPNKMAAMLLASDLDAVLAGFDTEQLKIFTAAVMRRVEAGQQAEASRINAAGSPGTSAGILTTQSFQRG